MACRGQHAKIVFDFDDPMGDSHLRRLRRMRAGLPDRRADAGDATTALRRSRRQAGGLACARICGVGCQLTYHVKDNKILYVEGRDGPANHEPAVRQGPLRLRLRRTIRSA